MARQKLQILLAPVPVSPTPPARGTAALAQYCLGAAQLSVLFKAGCPATSMYVASNNKNKNKNSERASSIDLRASELSQTARKAQRPSWQTSLTAPPSAPRLGRRRSCVASGHRSRHGYA
mmetsp:Transcript_10090/g.19768  ORF Transcript_10090/g.19768 Transcript_10090/m.19768 type:complete len:120 (+) Transcript_10090:1102-1461(+)